MSKIIYTLTDEAPMLATASLLPIVRAYAGTAGVELETRDISLAGRILAAFKDVLPEEQRTADALAELGELVKSPEANVIKLPNISASVPQLRAAIKELQADGYALPEYPDEPKTDEEKDAKARYDSVKGSAVNPVLREGNSDRRAPKAVKAYAKRFPHSMGEWTPDSKTAVATMGADDFRANEQSVTLPAADVLTIEFTDEDGKTTVLKEGLKVLKGEVVDGTFMSAKALDAFLAEQVKRAKEEGILFSAHLKATMMKVSDPVIFGHVVKAYFSELFEKYGEQLAAAGLSANNGLAAIEGGSRGFAFASGLAAEDTLVRSICRPGDHVVIPDDAYGGTFRLIDKVFSQWGIEHTPAPVGDVDAIRAAMRPATKLVWLETPTNPLLNIGDIEAVAEAAHAGGARLVVDNTFASPYLQQPLTRGADVVLHSSTKYLGGHSDVVGGLLVTDDEQIDADVAFLQNGSGGVPGPFDAYLTMRGIKTLGVRMDRHCDNAEAVVDLLAGRSEISSILYPGLPEHPGHEVAARQMSRFGGMISVRMAGGREAAQQLCARTEIFTLAESLAASSRSSSTRGR